MTFTHVLVPTDFSEPATQALRYALEEATLHHAKVTLLTCHAAAYGHRGLLHYRGSRYGGGL